LVYFAQALKYYNIKVKAFIGVENYDSLIYKDFNATNSNIIGRNANIYIDDLKSIGLSEASDIYVSFLCNTDEDQLIDIKNVFKGRLITEPYSEYLKKHNNLKILTFTCGPIPMMQKVHNITAQYHIRSYVLMEKRMACGIGVCFSCVCKTIINSGDYNSRVCIDGPIFESKQINWNE
jgi:NAD(P)H-flavin reductase